ncbi:MAG: RdgB/HAM1 family non-canonical purine NTP pyrophosphatase [Bryobacterales bacterium]|nr:RdgB/HAM1 family non-canonical purine NTP pyrophosphatase [Bryobacterales bacterium]
MILRCATSNAGKLREFRTNHPEVDIQPLDGLKAIPPCEEDGATFEANAIKKALYYSQFTADPIFADDSGLEVDALGGAPGVYSARYSPEGDDLENNRLLISNLRGVENRTARFVCVIALARQGQLIGTYKGQVEGRIVDEPRGPNGFGYDPHFFHEPFGCTFGEATAAHKMAISHRAQALDAMVAAATAADANLLS